MTDDARARVLARIAAANKRQAPASREEVAADYARVPRDYLTAHHDPAEHDIIALFVARAADYRAVVERISPAALPAAVARTLRARVSERAGDIVVPDGVPEAWLADCRDEGTGAVPLRNDPKDAPLTPAELDACAGVVTGCAVTIAETGTVVLDHGPAQGRRALSLVPDFHLVVVFAEQVEADLAGALGRLDQRRPHTLMSGPSATSDIEFTRVEGVHGPRTLHVLVVG
jgi:L-lactate dehydrogenase complex protein LldG